MRTLAVLNVSRGPCSAQNASRWASTARYVSLKPSIISVMCSSAATGTPSSRGTFGRTPMSSIAGSPSWSEVALAVHRVERGLTRCRWAMPRPLLSYPLPSASTRQMGSIAVEKTESLRMTRALATASRASPAGDGTMCSNVSASTSTGRDPLATIFSKWQSVPHSACTRQSSPPARR